jgi:hypothetical protein
VVKVTGKIVGAVQGQAGGDWLAKDGQASLPVRGDHFGRT